MSTQDDSGISFEISNVQQSFRLLELPPSLLALITSEDPPCLWLKSAESPSANVDSKQPSPGAVLCTDDHTYQLRQVQSSNSIFILQQSGSGRGDDDIPSSSVSAIAQCTATLELIPSDTAASFDMVSRFLKESLPVYKGTDTDLGLGETTTFSREYKNKNALLQDAPFSTEEFNKTWQQLCAFEVLGRAWLPTASALAMVWKSILSAASVRGVTLEQSFDSTSLAEVVEIDGYPRALFMAVVRRLVSDTDYLTLSTEIPSAPLFTSDTSLKDVSLIKDKTVQWIGIVCLQRLGASKQGNTEGIVESEFLARWRDLLPEGWRKLVSMNLLKAKFFHSDPFKEKIIFGEGIYDPTSLESLPSASTGGKANRKWHEKFKTGRK